MMAERGVEVDHSTINRWVLKCAPELDQRIRPHLNSTTDSWRVDETYIEVRVEIPVPSRRFGGQYLGLPAECEARWQGGSPLFP
jgi:hypothetical protein